MFVNGNQRLPVGGQTAQTTLGAGPGHTGPSSPQLQQAAILARQQQGPQAAASAMQHSAREGVPDPLEPAFDDFREYMRTGNAANLPPATQISSGAATAVQYVKPTDFVGELGVDPDFAAARLRTLQAHVLSKVDAADLARLQVGNYLRSGDIASDPLPDTMPWSVAVDSLGFTPAFVAHHFGLTLEEGARRSRVVQQHLAPVAERLRQGSAQGEFPAVVSLAGAPA